VSAPNSTQPPHPSGRVLITGAEGFTGHYLVPELQNAGFTTLSGVRGPAANPKELSFDLASPGLMEQQLRKYQPTAIVHLAAISFAAHGDPGEIFTANALGTLNLLNAISAANLELEHLIVASSAAVYGEQSVAELHEDLIPQPRSDYGISKLASEHLALSKSSARNLAITRPFNYTGVGQPESFLIPKLVAHFALRKPFIELGNLGVAREFNDVRWAVRTYTKLLSIDCDRAILNLCSGQTYTLRQIVTELENITGHSLEIRVNPDFVRENDPPLICGATQRATSLGMPAPTEQPSAGLRTLLEWMCASYNRDA